MNESFSLTQSMRKQETKPKRKAHTEILSAHFKAKRKKRLFLSLLFVAISLPYLCWRFTIINPNSLTLSLSFFFTECVTFILGLTITLSTRSYKQEALKTAPSGIDIDVFVPCYLEPLAVVRRTVLAARDIDYPHQTWLLDDGKRNEFKELAEELGVRYLRRPTNEHAKAGNLNYALSKSKAEFFMVLDADHISMPHSIDAMLGYFDDAKVGLVQSPQDYYNTNAFQYIPEQNGDLWHDQSFFYKMAQCSAHNDNAASCVGTGAIYRRSTIDQIGGVPYSTVTEDIHTSIKMHKLGFSTVYFNEPVAYGIAATDLEEFYKTRHRWGHGNMQAVVEENVPFTSKLTFRQRLSYLFLTITYIEGWQQLFLYLIPVGALLFGLQPFQISIINILVVTFFPFLMYTILQELSFGYSRFWGNEIFAMSRWPIHLAAASGAFGRKIKWRTSTKTVEGKVSWKLMSPQICIASLSLIAIVFSFIKLAQEGFPGGPIIQIVKYKIFGVTPLHGEVESEGFVMDFNTVLEAGYTVELAAFAGFWASYNIIRCIGFVNKARKNARESDGHFFFAIPFPISLNSETSTIKGYTHAISESHFKARLYTKDTRFVQDSINVLLPAGELLVNCQVNRVVLDGDYVEIEGEFIWHSETEKDRLCEALYCIDWHRQFLHPIRDLRTPLEKIISRSPERKKNWVSSHFKAEHQDHYAVLSEAKQTTAEAEFICFKEFKEQQQLQLETYSQKNTHSVQIKILEELPLHSLIQRNLDHTVTRRYKVEICK